MHLNTIGAMLLCGLVMGLAFDFYRVACHRFSVSRWMIPGFDVVYWFLAVLLVFQVLLHRNFGEVRIYVFLGIGIGIAGYFGLISPTALKAIRFLFRMVQNLLQALWRTVRVLLIVPIMWIVRMAARLLETLFIVIAAILLWTFRLVAGPLGKLGRWVWKLLLPVRRALSPVARKVGKAREKWRQIREIFRRKP